MTPDLRRPRSGPERLLAELIRRGLSPDAIPAAIALAFAIEDGVGAAVSEVT